MRQEFDTILKNVKTAKETEKLVIEYLKNLREKFNQIGFVSGIIYSDGIEFKDRNIKTLNEYTKKLRTENNFPIFSGVDIFYNGLYEKLEESKLPYEQRRNVFIGVWQNIVGCGYITDIFMTPRWELSEGAKDELATANEKGITGHYVEIDEKISSH